MNGYWKEVARLRFGGERYRDHALDLSALTELRQFQKMVAETAEALWRTGNPDRKNLPPHFSDRTRLCLRRIEEGSAVAPLEVYYPDGQQQDFVEPETEIEQAIGLAREVFEAVEHDLPLPERLPKPLLKEYAAWGQSLRDNELIELCLVGMPPARITPANRVRLAAFVEAPHEDQVDLTGEVLEADIHKGQFQLWIDETTHVEVPFTEEQEQKVTTALKEHRSVRIRVLGRGRFAPSGKPLHVHEVQDLQVLSSEEWEFDPTARPIEDILEELASQVPPEEWNRLPSDLTDNLDHYLYGIKRR